MHSFVIIVIITIIINNPRLPEPFFTTDFVYKEVKGGSNISCKFQLCSIQNVLQNGNLKFF